MRDLFRIWMMLFAGSLALVSATSHAQTAAPRVGAVDFNQALAVARTVTPPERLVQSLSQSVQAKLKVKQDQFRADYDRLDRDRMVQDENTLRQRQNALQETQQRLV